MTISSNEKSVLIELARQLNKKLTAAIPLIRSQIQQDLGNRIRSSEEWSSLQYGKLHYELGVDDAANRLESILNVWLESTQVQLLPVKVISNGLNGGLKIWGMDTTSFDLSKDSSPAYITLNDGTRWNWLEILLLAGEGIVSGYYFTVPNRHEQKYSRTGLGFMREKSGTSWKVPGEFSGVENNNWVSRSLQGFDKSLTAILERSI